MRKPMKFYKINRNLAFHWACDGYLETAKWLVHTFGLKYEDVEARMKSTIALAQKNNYRDVLEWLAQEFNVKTV